MARRTVGIGTALVLVWALAAIAVPARPALAVVDPAGGWPQFHGGPDRTGSTSASLITPGNVTSLERAWQHGGASSSSPAVVDGVVYVGSSSIGTPHSYLYAFAADGTGCSPDADCAPLWKGESNGGAISSSPAVAGGVVYVGSMDKSLYAFDAAGAAAPRSACRCDGAHPWDGRLLARRRRWRRLRRLGGRRRCTPSTPRASSTAAAPA